MRLAEKYGPWAVVTGASDGIGREMARALAAVGLRVVLVARRRDRLEALAAELEGPARVVALDLGDPGSTERLLQDTEDLDVGLVVLSAGFGTSGPFLTLDREAELDMVDVNCRSVVALAHGFAPRLVARKGGGLVFMSSLVAFQGVPKAATYAATKAFVQSLAEGLALELGPAGVDVLASAPGPVATGFADRAGMRMEGAMAPRAVAEGTLRALGRRGTVRPGVKSKLLEIALSTLPRWGRARAVGQVMNGMTRHRTSVPSLPEATPVGRAALQTRGPSGTTGSG